MYTIRARETVCVRMHMIFAHHHYLRTFGAPHIITHIEVSRWRTIYTYYILGSLSSSVVQYSQNSVECRYTVQSVNFSVVKYCDCVRCTVAGLSCATQGGSRCARSWSAE